MIKQVHLKHFRCFRDVTVDMEPFTVLIGKNDTGKTSMLDALSACASAQTKGRNNDNWRIQNATIGVSGDETVVSVAFGPDCRITIAKGVSPTLGPKASSPSSFAFAKRMVRSPREPYRLRPGQLKQPGKASVDSPLGATGLGLSGVLDRILSEHREVFDEIEMQLAERIPTVAKLRLRPRPSGKVVGFDLRSGAKLDASHVSDGVLLVLAFLTIVNDECAPALLMIEEPENGIHPKQLREVLRLLYSLTQRKENPIQVILTTHSPYVLDFVPPSSVRVFRRDKDSGDVEVVPFAEMEPITEMLAEGYSPGEAWYNSDEDHLREELPKHAGPRAQ